MTSLSLQSSIQNPLEICLSPKASILNALDIIEKASVKIVLIVDDQYRLLGTITDGDIRRGLLNGISLEMTVDRVMKKQFRFMHRGEDSSSVIEMMLEEDLRQIPVLDEKGKVLEILFLKDLKRQKELANPVVIMAGGKGRRLRPHTDFCPKPMLLVGEKPILQILLEQCIDSGFRDFYFSVNYLKEQIIDFFGDGSRWGVSIQYLVEDEPLGTAGSLQLLPDILTDSFLVLNGDVLTRFDPSYLIHFHEENNAQATLCVRQHELTVPFGVVQTNGLELSGFEEKPTYRHLVNAGVYVIDPQLLQLLLPQKSIDMPSLLHAAQYAGHRVVVCPIHEYWLDVGRPETLLEAQSTWGHFK